MAYRPMHSLAGGGGWTDEILLAGIVAILAAFLLWGWWKERPRAKP